MTGVKRFTAACSAAFLLSSLVRADTVKLKNGDTLTGTIGVVTSESVQFISPVFGTVTLPLKEIESFEGPTTVPTTTPTLIPVAAPIDAPVAPVESDGVVAGTASSAGPPSVVVTPGEWSGSVAASGALARGNTNKFTLGVDATAVYRRENEQDNDRLTFQGAYHFGRSGGGESDPPQVTDTDNWFVSAKYDRYFSEKLYGYASAKLEHDYIARLYYRIAPGIGLGYQWIDKPEMHFSTEAGVGYVDERYRGDNNGPGTDDDIPPDGNQYVSLRLAYHFDRKLNDNALLFHNLEFVPAVDNFSDYNLTTDAGLRVQLTEKMFTEFKFVLKRDSTPAEGALADDLLYTVGIGWKF